MKCNIIEHDQGHAFSTIGGREGGEWFGDLIALPCNQPAAELWHFKTLLNGTPRNVPFYPCERHASLYRESPMENCVKVVNLR